MSSQTSQVVDAVTGIAAPIASIVAPVIGGPALVAIVQLAAKYGPELIHGIIALFEKETVTVADVKAAFAPLKPYSAYGIPDKLPEQPI